MFHHLPRKLLLLGSLATALEAQCSHAVQSMNVLPGVDGDRLALERRYAQRPWRGAARRFVADVRNARTLECGHPNLRTKGGPHSIPSAAATAPRKLV